VFQTPALAILLGVVFASAAFAQEGRGAIAGSLTDAVGGVLQGAQITVNPGGVSAVSDGQGQFLVNGLAPGSYTVTISYVGFETSTKSVSVSTGQVVNADAQLALEPQSTKILVTAERASGEAEEVNRQRSADNVVQVLTSDVIRSLPNANMADALGRLPSVTIERDEGEGKYVQIRGTEPRLSNVTLDGVNVPSPESGVRQIKLDTIPADLVESVEINKTLQANMDADGIGGSVNLVTKTAGERPTISVSGMGGYMPILGGRGLTEMTGTVGQRFGASKRLGLLIGGSYDWNGRGIDDIEPVPDLNAQNARVFDSMDIREYRYYRSRWGLAGSADYKLGDGSGLYLRPFYSDFKNYGDRWVYSLTAGAPPSFNTQLRRPDYTIGSIVLGGKHVLATTWYTWDLSVSRSSQTGQVGDRNASFDATALDGVSNCQYDAANTKSLYLPQFTPACFTEAYNPANFTLSDVNINHGLTAQLNLQATGAMAKRYKLGSHLAWIEVGGKFRNAHKFDNTFQVDYAPNTSVAMTLFPSRFSNSDYYQGAYKLGPNPSFQDVFAYVNSNLGNFTVTDNSSGNGANFDLVEKVSAGYLMNTIDFSKVRLIVGVRFEGTNLGTRTPQLDQNGMPTGVFRSSGSYVNVLPSASVRFALTHDTYLRLVYSRGISRPDPQDIAQALTIDSTAAPTVVSLGNPNLKPETADNVDVLVEHYLNPFGMISAGFFYKNLADPIVTHTCAPPTVCPGFPGDEVTQPVNAGSAWVSGFEVAYLQHLSFLPGALRGLGISANYGYTASRADLGPDFSRTDHPRLVRSAPNTWNISPTYDMGRVSVRLGLSYNAANIAAYQFSDGVTGGIRGPFGDNYFYAHLQVDAQGSVRLTHELTFVMYGLNLNNEVFGFYNGSPQYMVQREYYRPTVAAGFRWSPWRER
jgi:TonB-dependent receptor